ncbi:MAG: cytochrome c oxidase assembly factor Coa1 family protein [Planctomycetota bacterium]|nr:cytochrome c oxidase assembly factor Coa1 family protein [Planctomycetota bacterium]
MENCDSTPAASPCQSGWMGRNWKWFVPILLLLCVVVAVGLFWTFVGKGELLEVIQADRRIKASEPFKMAMEAIRADAEVVKRLGEPLEQTGQASGEVPADAKAKDGNANFYFEIKGLKDTADVHCQGKMIDGKWGLSTLNVTFADRKRHSVEVAGDSSLDEAPAWSP